MVDIAAGGAHSACITSSGELYTWGKGRYGRLGHGDSEDQTRPKLVSRASFDHCMGSLLSLSRDHEIILSWSIRQALATTVEDHSNV